jgi:hypothetical protein
MRKTVFSSPPKKIGWIDAIGAAGEAPEAFSHTPWCRWMTSTGGTVPSR